MDMLIAFLISVTASISASVACHYIIKWLDNPEK